MVANSRRLVLLGPQPKYESLTEALRRLDVAGRIALVTAGWEEDEALDDRVKSAISSAGDLETINLSLFQRSEQLFAHDSELIEALRERQDELRQLRDIYRVRLDHGLDAARHTLATPDKLLDCSTERESAVEAVRQLDRQYYLRTAQVCDAYDERLQIPNRHSVAHHRHELAELLANVGVIVIAGGHAAIILNRLKLFDILGMNPTVPVVAWSGGAMALADQIVFFHDSPPQGAGNAEVLRAGMGLFSEVLPLPSARTRLKLDDHLRVSLFAQRFKPFDCVVFDEQTIMDRDGEGGWEANAETVRLGADGTLVNMQP